MRSDEFAKKGITQDLLNKRLSWLVYIKGIGIMAHELIVD